MSIAVDFDGVLSNTIKKWISIFNMDYSAKYSDLKLSYNKISEFGFYRKFNMTYDDARGIFAVLGAVGYARADRADAGTKDKDTIRDV